LRFRLEQLFRAPLAAVARAYTEPAFYERLARLPRLGRPEILERVEDGGVVRLQIRYRFTGELSAAVRKVIDPDRLTWVEHTVHDLARLEVDFRMAPDHYPDKLRSAGRYRFEADGDRTRRVADGDLTVRVPIVGSAVERAIVSGMRDHLNAEIPILEGFVTGTV
jgi:Protein of unknown function (DUF2505)